MSIAVLPTQPSVCRRTTTAPSGVRFGLGCIAVLVALFYAETLADLAARWLDDPNYSHGFLVPLISGWLAWRWLKHSSAPLQGQPALGCLEIAAGTMLHLAAIVMVWPPLAFVGLLLVLRGLLVALAGRTWAQGLNFPILFLFFMFPLPVRWTGAVAVWLQEIVSWASAGILDPFVVCHRSGHSIFLAGVPQPLIVAEECSGLRQIVAFVALAALIGYLCHPSLWRRGLLLCAAAPVAIVANVLRVLLMAAGALWFGTEWIDSWLHGAPALVTLPIGLAMLLGIARLCFRSPPPEEASASSMEAATSTPSRIPRRSLIVVSLTLIVALTAQASLQAHLHQGTSAEYPSLRQTLAQAPLTLVDDEPWRGADDPNTEAMKNRMRFADDFVARLYTNDQGLSARLYVIYSREGEDREHHPEICIRDVGGAPEDTAFAKTIALDSDGRRSVQRFRFRTSATRFTVVYYWHYTLDPTVPEGQSFLQALHQRLGRRAPSVTVQVATDASQDELDPIEAKLLAAVDAALCRVVLPPSARIGCERLPIRLQ